MRVQGRVPHAQLHGDLREILVLVLVVLVVLLLVLVLVVVLNEIDEGARL
jgi:hypothetical protein